MSELADVLQEQGFDAVETDLPGGWSTDGDWTVVVQTKPRLGGGLSDYTHTVYVYEAPAWGVGVGTPLAGRTTDSSNELAIRRALDEAGYSDSSDA